MATARAAQRPPERGEPEPGPLAEALQLPMSDGVPELLSIHGRRTGPVVLYVHGGPGSAETPALRYYCGPLAESMVVVAWEQRGAGKLFDASRLPAPPTIERHLDDLGESVIAVENSAVGTDGDSAFLHAFDEHTVGGIGAGEREYLVAMRARHYDRIDLSVPDGRERFLGSAQPGLQLLDFVQDPFTDSSISF